MKAYLIICLISIFLTASTNKESKPDLPGAWESVTAEGVVGQWIITNRHFAIAYYKGNQFISTEGGSWSIDDKKLTLNYEFHTADPEEVGEKKELKFSLKGDKLEVWDKLWTRVDDTNPGQLSGAWLITGRERNGEVSKMIPGARKTMKILSGTRFQWIAYNSETPVFSGTGGGQYSTEDGEYTEIIKFFSRDSTRVGAELNFDFELKDGQWHHSGKSSKGDPIYEVWSDRVKLGI